MGQPIPTVSPPSPAAAAFPILVQGRRPHWSFRGLLDVHSRYGLSARCIAKATHLSRRLRRFCYLHRRSDSYRLERPSCRMGITPTEEQHLCTAHTRSDPLGGWPRCAWDACWSSGGANPWCALSADCDGSHSNTVAGAGVAAVARRGRVRLDLNYVTRPTMHFCYRYKPSDTPVTGQNSEVFFSFS